MLHRHATRVLLAAAALAPFTARADTLTLHDGRKLVGEVTQTDAGYVIKLKAGQLTIPATDVVKWDKDATPTVATPSTPTVTPPPVPAPASSTPKTLTDRELQELRLRVAQLIRQGGAALRNGDAKAAAENFLDARALCDRARIRLDAADADHYQLLEGLGTAWMSLARYDRVNEPFDKAYASPFKDRALILNRAILDMTQHVGVMRGVKDIKAYLDSTSDNDEPALNLLGALLNQAAADPKLVKLPLFQQASATYDEKNKALERTRPNEGRWGVDWLKSFDLSIKKDAFDNGMRNYKSACDRRDKAADEVASAEKQLQSARNAAVTQPRVDHSFEIRVANDRVKNAQDLLAKREAAVKTAWEKIEFPTWPKTFPVALPEFAGGGSFGEPKHKPVEVTMVTPPTATHKPDKKPAPGAVDADPQPPTPTSPTPPSSPPAAKAGMTSVTRYAAAVPVATDLLLTAAAPAEGATEFRLEAADGNSFTAQLVRKDAATGLALLRVPGQHFPFLNLATGFTGGEVTGYGFPEVSIFNPVVEPLAGNATAPKPAGWTVSLRKHPRLAGTPLLDKSNALVGLTLGDRDAAATQLPAATADQIRSFLAADAPSAPCANPDPRLVLQLTATRDAK